MFLKKIITILAIASSSGVVADPLFLVTPWAKLTGAAISHRGNIIEVTFDQSTIINAIPEMKTENLLNSEVTQTEINENTDVVAISIAMLATPAIMEETFNYPDMDKKVHVTEYLTVPDEYGNLNVKTICSFDFSKDLNDKINYEDLPLNTFNKILPHFKFSSWAKSLS